METGGMVLTQMEVITVHFFVWNYAKIGIGIGDTGTDGINETIYTIGVTYSMYGGVRTELEYVGNSGDAVDIQNPLMRLSLVATF